MEFSHRRLFRPTIIHIVITKFLYPEQLNIGNSVLWFKWSLNVQDWLMKGDTGGHQHLPVGESHVKLHVSNVTMYQYTDTLA